MFIYFCENCKKFDAFKSKEGNFKCPDCGGEYLALGVTVDEWNEFSNEQMLEAIDLAQKPQIEIKKPVFDAKTEIARQEVPHENEKSDFENTIRHRKKKALLLLIISVALVLIAIIGAIVFFVLRGDPDITSEEIIETSAEQQTISRKVEIGQLYSSCLSIYDKGDKCASIALDKWNINDKNFKYYWDRNQYANDVAWGSGFKANEEMELFWKNAELIPQEISRADVVYKSITDVPEDEKAFYEAVKELYVMVSAYANQVITFPDGYDKIRYGDFITSNRQQFETLKSRVEMEKK